MTEQSQAVESQEPAPEHSEDVVVPESSQDKDANFIPPEQTPDAVQQRFNKLTYDKHQAERKFDELSGRFAELEQKLSNPVNKPPETLKTIDDFDHDNEKYTEYLIDQRATQIVDQRMNDRETTLTQTQHKQEQEVKTTKFNQSFDAYAKDNPEVLELANQMPGVITSQTMFDFLMDSDKGPQLQHALMKNYQELTRIQALSPMMQAKELGILEYKMSQAPVKKLSNAPDPSEPLGGGTASDDGYDGVRAPIMPN